MAEQLSGAKPTGFDKQAFADAVKSVNATKAKASELQSQAAGETKAVCDQHNFDKTAFTFVARLARKEPADAQAVIASVVTYANAMGLFDQSDMFQDHIAAMRDVVARVDAGSSHASSISKLGRKATAAAPEGAAAH